MATFHPYLFFGGNCAAAFTRYGEIFGGESFMMRMGDAPDQTGVPDDKKDSIIHAALTFEDGASLMGSDDPMTQSFGPVQGMQVSQLRPRRRGRGTRVRRLSARGGNPVQPLIETFFSPVFGMVVDEFGTPWMIVAETPAEAG